MLLAMPTTSTWPAPWSGLVLLVAVALVYDILLSTVRRYDRAYPSTNPTESTWWFGYARDLANFAGMFGFAVAFRALGFAGPRALLCGVILGLVAYGLDFAIARKIGVRYTKITLGAVLLAMVIPAVVFRRELEDAVEGLLRLLF